MPIILPFAINIRDLEILHLASDWFYSFICTLGTNKDRNPYEVLFCSGWSALSENPCPTGNGSHFRHFRFRYSTYIVFARNMYFLISMKIFVKVPLYVLYTIPHSQLWAEILVTVNEFFFNFSPKNAVLWKFTFLVFLQKITLLLLTIGLLPSFRCKNKVQTEKKIFWTHLEVTQCEKFYREIFNFRHLVFFQFPIVLHYLSESKCFRRMSQRSQTTSLTKKFFQTCCRFEHEILRP